VLFQRLIQRIAKPIEFGQKLGGHHGMLDGQRLAARQPHAARATRAAGPIFSATASSSVGWA
jgi:hypothetical protein